MGPNHGNTICEDRRPRGRGRFLCAAQQSVRELRGWTVHRDGRWVVANHLLMCNVGSPMMPFGRVSRRNTTNRAHALALNRTREQVMQHLVQMKITPQARPANDEEGLNFANNLLYPTLKRCQ
jgi:hypothetical protein